jgi:two-component system response regulator YesN
MMTDKVYDLMLAEDDELERRVIQRLVAQWLPGVRLVGMVTTVTELLIRMHQTQPQLVVLDSRLPGIQLTVTLNLLLSQHPQLKVIILADYDEARLMENCLRFGAFAYLIRPVQPEQLLKRLLMATRVLDTLR